MIIAAPSVPHTGHNFMCKRILKNFQYCSASVTLKEMREIEYSMSNTKLDKLAIMDHFHPNTIKNWKYYMENYPTVISLRHPARCLLSHELRNTIGTNINRFHTQWQAMMELVPHCKEVYFLHLDNYDIRERQAAKIMDVIGEDFDIDWSVSEETGSKAGTHEADITDALMARVPESFVQFYDGAAT